MEQLIININNYSNENINPDKKINIIYSILVHESIICILELIYNICYFNKQNNFLIILHPNNLMYNELKKLLLPKFIFINTPYNKNKYTYSLLKGHIDNFNLISNYDFDLFCLLASNCMIVKNIDINYLLSNAANYALYEQHYIEIKPIDNTLEFLKNNDIIELFKKNNISIKKEHHEGSFYNKKIFELIINFIFTNKIEQLITTEFVAEEILLASLENYYTNKITHRICKFIQSKLPRQKDIDNIINSKNFYIIKKVPRIPNHRVINLIKQLYK